jgi:hypothetical protein
VALGVVKLFELPYQTTISLLSAIATIFIFEFLLLLCFQRGSARNILCFFIVSVIVNLLFLIRNYSDSILNLESNFLKIVVLIVLLSGLFLFIRKSCNHNVSIFYGVLVTAILIMFAGNFCIGNITTFNPQFDTSSAPEIINLVKSNTTNISQLWVYENRENYFHYDFTYWDILSRMHPINTYAPYTLKTSPALTCTIGNVTYSTVDYIVDTLYIENGNQNIPNYTFKIQNISVYLPDRVLPNAFFIRNDQVYPLQIDQFEPDDVIVSGKLLQGDVIVLKNAYYPGWTVNGVAAEPFLNMTSLKITSPTTQARFKFDPLDYKVGAVVTGCGIALAIGLLVWSGRKKLCVR